MISDFLKKNIQSQANFVEYGYGQVEPNHLSAQRTGQIYAQLPAAADIDVLENGQLTLVQMTMLQANGCLFIMKLSFIESISLIANLQW